MPIHFKGEAAAPGVKTQGGVVSHLMRGRGSQLPAEGSAGVPRGRLSGMNLNETHASVGHQGSRGRDAGGAGARQEPAGRLDPQPACREPEPVAARRQRRPRSGAAAPAGAAPAAAPMPRSRCQEGRGQEGSGSKKEAARSSCRPSDARRAPPGAALRFFPEACGATWQDYRSSSSSDSAIPDRNTRARATTPGFWFVDELGARHGGSSRERASTRASWRACASCGQELWLLKPTDLHESQRLRSASGRDFYKVAPRGDSGGSR
jgi:hypothetical protein